MKRKISFLFTAMCALLLVGCSSLPKELSKQDFKVSPGVLEVVNSKVEATVTATVPADYMPSKATITITPVLQYAGKELLGTPKTYQGSKVEGNNTVIGSEGGTFSQSASFPYTEEMRKSTLYARVTATLGSKSVTYPDVWVADGVIATATLASPKSTAVAIGKDKFQRIIEEKQEADIKFLIQQANIRKGELSKSEIKALINSAIDAQKEENKNVKSLDISSYASPDGPYKLNENLAGKRGMNTEKELVSILKKNKANNATINSDATPEDWDGFKSLMEKSNIEDKDLILRVLSMHSDPAERENEIKNMSAAFKEIKDQILPQLRRSKLALNVEVIGKSDAEISSLASSNPSQLNVEELLYAATLTNSVDEKARIYQKVENQFPSDWRGFNNYGAQMYAKGDYEAAASAFNKANSINASAPEVQNNLAVIALINGNVDNAQVLLGKAGGIPETTTNMALVNMIKGNYAQAVKQYGSSNSNNAVVARIMTNDYDGASKLLSQQASQTGESYYLAAIIGARTNNLNAVMTNLSKAISADPKYKQMAMTDAEFAKFPEALK